MRILLVEDDRKLAGLIERMLESARYNVDIAYDGDSGTDLALRGIHEIAIIDWMLPGRDGPSICRAVRSARLPMAILMLTARTQVEDRVGGLDAGADDYLTKPFAMDELLARLRALQRRFTPATSDPYELRVGSIVMDLHTHSVRRGEHTLELTPKEWTLLEYLLRHANQAVTRTNILDYVWSYEGSVRLDLVDVYISYLRSKLNLPGKADPIATVRGIGYRLEGKYA
jgi:two-component system OmpR family response regulator